MTYADQAAVEAYIAGWTTDDPAALAELIAEAEADLDAEAFVLLPRRAGAPKLDPAALDPEDREALKAATCAQVEYRHEMGAEHFVRAQRQRVARRGVTLEGKLPILGPKAWRELRGTGLTAMTTSVGASRPDPDELWRQA